MTRMEASSWSVLAAAWLAAVIALLFKAFCFGRGQLNHPPGPKPWPIIGNLNLIGPLPHRSLYELSKKYGPIMQLQFGSFPVVIASSAEMAKLFLKTHDSIFASRPKTAAGKYITYNYMNITWAPYGPHWRQGRKIFLMELFSARCLELSEYIRVEEIQAFLRRLYASSGKAITVKEQLSHLTLSIISRIVLGKKYFSESASAKGIVTLEEFQKMLDELFLLSGVVNIGDWIPWVNFLDLQGYVKRMKALYKKFDQFHDHVLEAHNVMRRGQKDFVPKDMVDVLLQLANDPNLEVKLTQSGIKAFILDLIGGGTDTSATSMEWAMSEILKHPEILEKATEELDRVIGRERWVEEKDFPNLPYIEAIIKETMRMHPVVVMLPPHLALEDCKVAGYDIRRGTPVFVNTWTIGRDPTLWDRPDEFRPERFIGSTIDVKGRSFELLPFGTGRRMCPGYSLGLKMIRSCLANMLHGFMWKLPENMMPEDLNMEEVYGLATTRKLPLIAVAGPRLPAHVYY